MLKQENVAESTVVDVTEADHVLLTKLDPEAYELSGLDLQL